MAEDDSREDVIKYNIQDFLPYICDCVKATDLLVHLHFFTLEQKKEIFQLGRQNNVTGMQKAMQILLHEVDDMGRFTAFRKAMEDSEYPKIVKMLDGETITYDGNCRKLIDLFAKEIIGRLNPEDLLPSLVSEGVLTGNDTDEVRAEEKNHGKGRACWMLLFHLPNRVENWFRIFMNVLVDTNYTDIAEILEPDLYQKILLQREETINALANLKQADDSRNSLLTGMTQCGQTDVLENFKDGRHKIIGESSVVKKGLDITKRKVVLHCKIDARLQRGECCARLNILTEEEDWMDANEEKNAMPENEMNNIVPKLQADIEDHQNMWGKEIQDSQEAARRRSKECRVYKCGNSIRVLVHTRNIQGAHHVVVNEHVGNCYIRSDVSLIPYTVEPKTAKQSSVS